jgi:DNA helicase-2/ATP-dependent DNA helicase PcrA
LSNVVLNEEQQTVVNARDGVWVVLAGPGSGKSRCLVERYLKMLRDGVPFESMLNLTFTRGAAQEMASRSGILDADSVFRTFHSFCLELLKKERDKLPFETCETIIPVELQEYTLLFELVDVYNRAINWRTLRDKIAAWKNSNIRPDQAIDESRNSGVEYFYALGYRDYELKSREQGWLDFDNLILETVNLLETNQEVKGKYKRKYLSVDEAQDCSEIQFKLLQLLFDGNVFAVGDENQLIYEFRDARPNNLTNFARVFPGAKVLYLGTNHRSSASLVNFLKEILPVDNGLASRMTTYNPEGVPFTITKYEDDEEEAEQVLKKITDPENTAVIARTNRQLFLFQRICATKGIRCNFLGRKDLWDQNEVKKLLSYAKSAPPDEPADEVLKGIIHEKRLLHIYSKVGSGNPMEASPVENLNGIVKIAASKGKSIKEFLDYIRRITHAKKAKSLTLSTVHQFKGMEIDVVYLIGTDQGVMPHREGELNEEARIFFVAASRACKELHISFHKNLSMYLLPYQDRIVKHGAAIGLSVY